MFILKCVKMFVVFFVIISGVAHAAGTIDFLEVDNDVVLFSTTQAKTHTLPACVTADNANLWSVSLASDSGRATYSLILTAMAKGDNVGLSIQSADNCADRTGVESANEVSLISNSVPNNADMLGASSSRVGVYKGDGITRLGTYTGMNSSNQWTYLNESAPSVLGAVSYSYNNQTFYFSEENCQGIASVSRFYSTEPYFNPALLDGSFFVSDGSFSGQSKSRVEASKGCVNAVYELSSYTKVAVGGEHSLCGMKACILKNE